MAALCFQARGCAGLGGLPRCPPRVESQPCSLPPRPPFPAPSRSPPAPRAHLLHAPPLRLTPPRGRELPSCPYFPHCNLSFLLMNVGLAFFFFLLMERKGLGIPRRGLCLQSLAQTRFPFLPGPHFYSSLSPAGSPARARLGASHIVLNVRAALLWPSAPRPLHPGQPSLPSLAPGQGLGASLCHFPFRWDLFFSQEETGVLPGAQC